MGIGKEIGSAALGGLTGGVGGLVTGAIGGLGSLMGIGRRKEKKAREAEEREHQRQLEYVGLQAQYNKEQAKCKYRDWETDRKSTRLNSSHITRSRMPSSA